MNEVFHSLFMGMGSLLLAPSGHLRAPRRHLTVPPSSSIGAVAFDFSMVSRDLDHSIDKVRHEKQLEMNFTGESVAR
jgi:hypothetical protein